VVIFDSVRIYQFRTTAYSAGVNYWELKNMNLVKKSRVYFTLLELIVIVAVIGILITLLLPSLKKARLETESAVCKSNSKQISYAVYSWSGDYNAKIPSAWAKHDGQYKYWHLVMLEYLDHQYEIMNCPTAWDELEDNVLRKVPGVNYTSDYGWNWSGYNNDPLLFGLGDRPDSNVTYTNSGHRGGTVYMAEIEDPNNMLTFGDRAELWAIRSLIGNTNFPMKKVMPMVHKGSTGGNVTFLDGSVRFMTAVELYSPSSKSMWSKAVD
jgi:prepilin-type processing-associated H-X9-DG protein